MSRFGLNYDNRTRHEFDGRWPFWVRCLTGVDYNDSIGPILLHPIAECLYAIILSEWEFRITRLKPKFANPSKFDQYSGGCLGCNPPTLRTPPSQQKRPMLN